MSKAKSKQQFFDQNGTLVVSCAHAWTKPAIAAMKRYEPRAFMRSDMHHVIICKFGLLVAAMTSEEIKEDNKKRDGYLTCYAMRSDRLDQLSRLEQALNLRASHPFYKALIADIAAERKEWAKVSPAQEKAANDAIAKRVEIKLTSEGYADRGDGLWVKAA